jgi:hypothetical protein
MSGGVVRGVEKSQTEQHYQEHQKGNQGCIFFGVVMPTAFNPRTGRRATGMVQVIEEGSETDRVRKLRL